MIRVNGEESDWREGMTIADLLREVNGPGRCAVVRINTKYVSRPHFEKTVIPDGSDVFLLPMISGG